ncbi:hypothetical protein ABPG75_003033 [Micractinium tetrahymenae]
MRAGSALRGGLLRLQAAAAAAAAAGQHAEAARLGVGSSQLTTLTAAGALWQHAWRAAGAVLPGGLRSAGIGSAAAEAVASSGAQAPSPEQQAAPLSRKQRRAQRQQQAQQQAQQQGQLQQEAEQQEGAPGKKRRRRQRQRGGSESGSERQLVAAPAADQLKHTAARADSGSGDGGVSIDAVLQAALHQAEQQASGGRAGKAAGRADSKASGDTEAAAGAAAAEGDGGVAEEEAPLCALPPARILQDDAHPIREADISRPAWFVLSRLRAAGHEAYIVGGTIRDLLLGGTPKDYDILSSAELHQIKRLFSRSHVVGRSFPVCQVHAEGTMIEVSSFSTHADSRHIPADASSHMIGRQKPKRWNRESATWAAARSDNASRRDFTVNGLLYDPFSRLLFDSVGGVEDCAARRLRTICPPGESFTKDPARILRGVRLAARAGLEVDPDTAAAMEAHATAIAQLPTGRLQMELGSLLGYGAARPSLALMWRLGLLDMLLPQLALYLRRHRVARAPRSPGAATATAAAPRRGSRANLLYDLAAELDGHVHPQRPGLDAATMTSLGRQARKHGRQLRDSGGQRRRGRRAQQAQQAEQAQQAAQQVLLPCVLSRAAVVRASALLMLEADLRGRPELQALLHKSGWTGPATAGSAGTHAGHAEHAEHHLGRHNEQHALWQRLERSLAQVGGEGADAAAAPEQLQQQHAEAAAGSKKKLKRHRQGRSLNAEERLVLGILSDPRFDFAAKTALPL